MAPYSEHRPSTSDGLYPPPRHHHGHRSREHSPDPSRLRPDPRYYSSHRSSSRSSSRNPPEQHQPPPNIRLRRTWPPSPVVEDEKASLAKEAYGSGLADSDISEASSRGTLDQQPIILEAESFPTGPFGKAVPSKEPGDGIHNSSPSSHDSPNKGPRGRRNTTDDSLELPETPLFTRRAPSPYVFMPKAPALSHMSSSTDAAYFSPDLKSSSAGTPLSEKRQGYAPAPETLAADPLKGNGLPRNNMNGDYTNTDVEYGAQPNWSSRGDRAPAPYSMNNDGPGRDFAKGESQPRLAEIRAEALNGRPRRGSDPASSSSRPRFDETSRPPAPMRPNPREPPAPAGPTVPIISAAAMQYAGDFLGTGFSRHSSSSRPSSPVDRPPSYPPSPPRSPRSGSYQQRTDSPRSGLSSVSGSLSGSRPASPIPSYAGQSSAASRPEEGVRRSSTFPIVADDRSQRTSRLASSSIHVDDEPHSPSQPRASLPYPVDDVNVMPSEEYHRYKPRSFDNPFATSTSSNRPTAFEGSLNSPVSSRPTSLEVPASRPHLNSRHTLDGGLPTGLPTLAAVTTAAAAGRGAELDSPATPKASSSHTEKPRGRCLTSQNSRNCQDWHSLNGSPNVDICAGCFETHVSPTSFQAAFKPAPRTKADPNVTCFFRNPWYKAAWQMTRQQQRFDLNFLHGISRAAQDEATCPGAGRDNRPWHTIYDKRGEAVHGFDICPCDVKKIEVLMPTLRGAFEESHNSGRRRRCNLRIESARCSEYINALREIDQEASKKRKKPDMEPFVQLARHKAQMRECARDDLVIDKEWHFAPQLPEFTVCEECYSSVVWPAIADGSPVASRFKRTPELVYEEKGSSGRGASRSGAAPVAGTSCQLYSPRMRKVFSKAVHNGDFAYLASRARERKKAEIELQEEFARLQLQANEWERTASKSGERRSVQSQQRHAALMAEFEKITDEWRRWE